MYVCIYLVRTMDTASLRILSPNTSMYRTWSTFSAWKMASVATGSTAEISDPKAKLSTKVSWYTTSACGLQKKIALYFIYDTLIMFLKICNTTISYLSYKNSPHIDRLNLPGPADKLHHQQWEQRWVFPPQQTIWWSQSFEKSFPEKSEHSCSPSNAAFTYTAYLWYIQNYKLKTFCTIHVHVIQSLKVSKLNECCLSH